MRRLPPSPASFRPRWTLAWLLLAAAATAQSPAPKQVAAPASDILAGLLRLPEPRENPARSRAAVLDVELAWEDAHGWSWTGQLPVEEEGGLSIALLSTEASRWRVLLAPQGGELVEPERLAGVGRLERHAQVLTDVLPGWIVDRRDLEHATPGLWTVRIEVPGAATELPPAGGWILAAGQGSMRVEAWTSTAMLLSDERIGVNARLVGGEQRALVERGVAWIDLDGRRLELELVDDGRHEDAAANDGLYGALLPEWTSGRVRAQVELSGHLESGAPFQRSVQLAFGVLERRVALTGAAATQVDDATRLRIDLEAWPLGPPAKLHVSAEVWGTADDGRSVPVCWLSRMDQPEPRGDAWALPLWLDGRWLDVAGARPPLELRHVRVQDPDSHVPFDRLERLPLEVGALPPVVGSGRTEVTTEMLMGPLPSVAGVTPGGPVAHAPRLPDSPALMLVHGYCSSGNIWPAADFTQPKVVFLDPDANRTHDYFAQLIDQRARSAGVLSFGVVAHSQGGAAALHLYTYYQSGLDWAVGPRLIQSLATPYQGTPLATWGGFACGQNDDMVPANSTIWLSGIPSWARAQVWYWTTSDAGSACNLFTSLLLSDPEDGTVEQFRGQLPGANNMGHTTGWCHTTGMTYPASYTDHARNQAMNAAAAR